MIFARETGAGAPVLLLHSSGLSSLQWRKLTERLAATHRVVAPDLVGVGKSPAFDPARMHTFDFHEDVESLEELALRLGAPVRIVGHSYGGLLALQLALRGRVSVASVIAYEPVAFGVLHSTADASLAQMPATESFLDLSNGLEGWLGRFVDWWNGPGTWAAMPEAGRASFIAAGPKVFAEVRSLSSDKTPHTAFAKVGCPALLLSGTQSPLPARRVCAIVAAAMTNGRHVEVEGAGHMGPLSHADAVNAVVAEFLAGA